MLMHGYFSALLNAFYVTLFLRLVGLVFRFIQLYYYYFISIP